MQVDAFAKLTLSLRVTGVRADGYHEIDALMVTVTEPHDTLTIVRAPETSIEITGSYAAPTDASNLVWRALDALGVQARVQLRKEIPPGGGLGGGSADAAAVLRAFGSDAQVAATLGADVPFCLRGGAARVTGIGDVLEPIAQRAQSIVIATPPFGCETAAVYRAWDELGGPHAEPNDLEPAAHHVEPRLRAFKDAIEKAAGAPAFLAGSGSSYAVVCADARAARDRIAKAVEGRVWIATCPTR